LTTSNCKGFPSNSLGRSSWKKNPEQVYPLFPDKKTTAKGYHFHPNASQEQDNRIFKYFQNEKKWKNYLPTET
jgi:hypothetical protein